MTPALLQYSVPQDGEDRRGARAALSDAALYFQLLVSTGLLELFRVGEHGHSDIEMRKCGRASELCFEVHLGHAWPSLMTHNSATVTPKLSSESVKPHASSAGLAL